MVQDDARSIFADATRAARRKFEYWQKKGIPGPRPWPLVGVFVQTMKMGLGFYDLWAIQQFGKIFGYFDGSRPILAVSDPDMLRSILVKDFPQFINRRNLDINGPLLEQSVTVLHGQKWKDVRSALVPTFTSGRLKQMNGLINECCDNLVSNLGKKADADEEFECQSLFRTVTMDVIASTFFGTKIDSQNDPKNEFTKNAKEAFDFTNFNPVLIIFFLFPWAMPLAKKLGLQIISKEKLDFFVANTKEIIRMRSESNVVRNDFIQLMMRSMNAPDKNEKKPVETTTEVQNADDSQGSDIISHNLSVGSGQEKSLSHANYKLTLDEVVAQAVIFFLAGFETSATALTFLTYCLAVEQTIQDKLRQSIEEVMQDLEEPTFESIAQMHYLDACVNEALRMYPPVSRTERECNEDWEYKGLKIAKGTVISIPIYAIQRDEEFWPNPDVYDPERFSYENKQKIKPYTFNTFGQGPRNCIGMRFAYYEIKMVMVHILRNFRILPSAKTEIPLQLKDTGFMAPKNGAWVKLQRL
ncbi:Cytochrome P450 3A9 [Hypsibius exemplaris]|uniref:Cytochrome P450 3A9 n=1 Tax=Hypsibius exemplaris TaxID=2072580 RepID=A0A1W0WFW9_HYPEX|nr:Cytochrome P450 3A9 [Hypsibius exemplaris]